MAEAMHTPGPWHAPHFADDTHSCNCQSVVSEVHFGAICKVEFDNGKRIGDGGNDAPPLEEAKANARLIAAAPDMLVALRFADALHYGDIAAMIELGWPQDGQETAPAYAMRIRDEAIRKAEGRANG